MKSALFILALSIHFIAAAQSTVEAYVKQGVDLHDRGYYEDALAKYDSAILIEPNSYVAHYEKAFTLIELKRYNQAADICKFLVSTHSTNKSLSEVYILYGSVLDMLGKSKEAVKVYDDGIKSFPTKALLHYNKAVTLANLGETQKAVLATKSSIVNNPYHASSHKLLASMQTNNKIYNALADITFLLIEPQGDRAQEQLNYVKELFTKEAKKTGENSYTINIDGNFLLNADKKKDDNFSSAEMIVSLSSALNVEEKYKNETIPERFARNFETLISSLKEGRKEGRGFSWSFYVPFLIDLQKEGHSEVISHILFVTDDDAENNKWLSAKKEKVDAFYQWFKGYKWPQVEL